MKLISILLILSFVSIAHADLDCQITCNEIKCEHTEAVHTDDRKGIGIVILRWVIYPLIEGTLEEIGKYVAEKYIEETGMKPGKITIRGK